jgi:sulfonate transport system permease protein
VRNKSINYYLKKAESTGLKIILPILIFVIWHYVTTTGKVSTLVLPTLKSVWEMLIFQLTKGTLLKDLGISLMRILKGYSMAAFFGVALGVLMGMSKRIHTFFILTFTSFRQIPMMAWVPLLVMWFGIGEESKVAVIFLASYFPILVNTVSGISSTDVKLLEVGRMYQLSKWKMFTKIYLPSAIPSIFVGLKLGLGISWMAVVGAEMIAASSGIGFRINDARSLMQYSIVFCGIIGIAVTGVLMDGILSVITKLCTPWKNRK